MAAPRSADGYRVWDLSGEGPCDLADKDPAYQEKMADIDAALGP